MQLPTLPLKQIIGIAALVLVAFGLGSYQGCNAVPAPDPTPAIALPAELHGLPNQIVVIRATGSGHAVRWKADPQLQKIDLDLADPKATIVIGPQPGRYWICAWTATRHSWLPWAHAEPSEAVHCAVVIDGAPTPPVPPVPPTPPEPTDPFYQTLKAAWQAETDPGRNHAKGLLAAIYKTTADNALDTCPTMGSWYTLMGNAIKAGGLSTQLKGMQRAIGDEFNRTLPRDAGAKLDKAQVGGQLNRMAKLLEALP